MNKLFFGLILFFGLQAQAQLQSPSEFLPGYGMQVSYYHQLENYFEHLTANSNLIVQKPYGKTYQDRSLNVIIFRLRKILKTLKT